MDEATALDVARRELVMARTQAEIALARQKIEMLTTAA